MKLCVCIIHNRDKNRVVEELVKAGFRFTIIGSTGGFLREGNTTFLIGIPEEETESLIAVIQANSCTREQVVNVSTFDASPVGAMIANPVKVPVGGAVMFFLPVERYERF